MKRPLAFAAGAAFVLAFTYVATRARWRVSEWDDNYQTPDWAVMRGEDAMVMARRMHDIDKPSYLEVVEVSDVVIAVSAGAVGALIVLLASAVSDIRRTREIAEQEAARRSGQ